MNKKKQEVFIRHLKEIRKEYMVTHGRSTAVDCVDYLLNLLGVKT